MKAMVTMAAILATTMLVHAQDSDAKRMQSEEMNPGSALTTRERTGDGAFKILIYGNSIALHGKPKNITFIQGAQHSYVPPKPWQTGERRK